MGRGQGCRLEAWLSWGEWSWRGREVASLLGLLGQRELARVEPEGG